MPAVQNDEECSLVLIKQKGYLENITRAGQGWVTRVGRSNPKRLYMTISKAIVDQWALYIYIWSMNFSHSDYVYEKSEAKMAAIDVQ
jgi:hypothetical protein